MKKLLPILLLLSLAANAAFLINRAGSSNDSVKSKTTRANTSAATKLAHIPDAAELAAIQDKLAALNLPPEVSREVLRALLWQPLHDRQRAMIEAKNANTPYWQQSGNPAKRLTADERAELRTLSEQIENRALTVLGSDALSGKNASRYSFLSPDKAAAIERLQRDYSDLRDGVADDTSLFKMPSDKDAHRLIRQEQRSDLAAILSPDELTQYDLRNSPVANDLRKRFSALHDSTEAEYKTAYDIARNLSTSKNDPAAQAAAAQQLRDLLGADRYTAFMRASDTDYTSLQGAATRFGLTSDTIDKVYNMRDQAASLSQQISSDKTLSTSDKQQALKTLSAQIRNDVCSNLGQEVGNAYLDNNMTWLKNLSNGGALTISPATGNLSVKPIAKDKGAKSVNKSASGAKASKSNAGKKGN